MVFRETPAGRNGRAGRDLYETAMRDFSGFRSAFSKIYVLWNFKRQGDLYPRLKLDHVEPKNSPLVDPK